MEAALAATRYISSAMSTSYAAVSCHVEALLDGATWRAYSRVTASAPGGFRIASLLRPPAVSEADRSDLFIDRAHLLAGSGPVGQHTHYGNAHTARPIATSPSPAEAVTAEAAWMRGAGLEPRYFCGGGWYLDADVAAVVAALGYVDISATSFRPPLADGGPRAALRDAAHVDLGEAGSFLELPTTHSVGMLARALRDSTLPDVVHFYFHDYDLCNPRRRVAIWTALRVLGRLRRPIDLDEYATLAAGAPGVPWSEVAVIDGAPRVRDGAAPRAARLIEATPEPAQHGR